MNNNYFLSFFIGLLSLIGLGGPLYSQPNSYITGGTVIAEFPLHFTNGYMFLTVPVIDTDVYGKAITLHRNFILDPASSTDGSFLPDDSLISVTGARKFYFPVSAQRTITADLVPTLGKAMYKKVDTSYYGVLGYAFLKRYMTVIDFLHRKVILYSTTEGEIRLSKQLDTSGIIVPYLDDAILAHCNCQFPTMWFEVKSHLLKEGRAHFSLAERQSVIFNQALEPKTQKYFDTKWQKDSLAGKKREPERIQVETFELGGEDIAKRDPRRVVADLPPIFRNLNIFITGTVAIDVLRTFSAVIIDPEKSRVILVK